TSMKVAPSRRMRKTSSTRCCTVALDAFAIGPPFVPVEEVGDPPRVPVVKAGVVDEGELFPAAAVAAEVGRPLDGQPGAGPEGPRSALGVGVAAGRALAPLAELLDGSGPEGAVVRAEEDARHQGQGSDGAAVQPLQQGAQVAGVVAQRAYQHPV